MTDSPLPEILKAGEEALEYEPGRLDEFTVEQIVDVVGRAVLHAAAEQIRALGGADPNGGFAGYDEGMEIAAAWIDPEPPPPDDGFRWHPLSECPDETGCPIHGRNEEPADCPPACSEAHTYDGGCQLHPGLDGVIAQSTDHEHPGWVWSCAEDDGCGWLSLGHDSAAGARRSYDQHRAKDCTRVMP